MSLHSPDKISPTPTAPLSKGVGGGLQIDVVMDPICPWCFIGKKRLEKALAQRPDVEFDIYYRPFMLNPDMPADGMDRSTYLQLKFGGLRPAEHILQSIARAAQADHVQIDFDRVRRTPNTLDCHRLMRWARTAGVQLEVADDMFTAYFQQGIDVSDREYLIDLARRVGMDHRLVAELLRAGKDTDLIRREDNHARSLGVKGVPFYIVDKKFCITGAESIGVFLQVFDLSLSPAITSPAEFQPAF